MLQIGQGMAASQQACTVQPSATVAVSPNLEHCMFFLCHFRSSSLLTLPFFRAMVPTDRYVLTTRPSEFKLRLHVSCRCYSICCLLATPGDNFESLSPKSWRIPSEFSQYGPLNKVNHMCKSCGGNMASCVPGLFCLGRVPW